MRYSQTLIPTVKQVPADAEITSHKLMIRAGLIRKVASGTYMYLPLGQKTLLKVIQIVRQEMNKAGAQEVLMPSVQPMELWQKTGRSIDYGEDLAHFTDRHGRENVLSPTAEEVVTSIAAGEISSYKQLPFNLYQISFKFRDEQRPRFGVIRSREFIMKDAYSFDRDQDGLNKNYQKMYDAYHRIFNRCGLQFLAVEADPGIMGGDVSHEFMVPAEGGEDSLARCASCPWAASFITDQIKKNKACPKCSKRLEFQTAIEVGHIFKLGAKYSQAQGAKFLDELGREKPVIMGCYGIGVNRIAAAAIEQSHDKDGIVWPEGISPYRVLILPLNIQDKKSKEAAFALYSDLKKRNIDVLLDERDERAGIKLKDADLIGVPIQIVIGEKNIQKGKVEIKIRKTGKIATVRKEDVLPCLKNSSFSA